LRFGDASGHEPGLALRIQAHGFGYPLSRLRWGGHYRESFSSQCTRYIALRFGDASGHEPGLALRIQSHGFGYPFAAHALDCSNIDSDFEMY